MPHIARGYTQCAVMVQLCVRFCLFAVAAALALVALLVVVVAALTIRMLSY